MTEKGQENKPFTWAERAKLLDLDTLPDDDPGRRLEPGQEADCRRCKWQYIFRCYTGVLECYTSWPTPAEYRSRTGFELNHSVAKDCPQFVVGIRPALWQGDRAECNECGRGPFKDADKFSPCDGTHGDACGLWPYRCGRLRHYWRAGRWRSEWNRRAKQ